MWSTKEGWGLLAVFHSFNGEHEGTLEVPLPGDGTYEIEEIYSDAEADVCVSRGKLVCRIPEDMRAVAVLARKA